MELRITTQTQLSRALAHAREQSDRLATIIEQASTGKRLLNPSDDPLASMAVLTNKAQMEQMDAFLFNIQESNTTLSVSASRLQEVTDLLSQARRAALEGAQTIYDAEPLANLAEEVDKYLTRLLDVSNTQQDGRYIYSGTATDTPSFVVTSWDSEGKALTFDYQGADERAEVAVAQNQSVGTRYTGSEVFQPKQRGVTLYSGVTGAAAGTGTDSGTGQGSLLVSHTATTYAVGSGVAPGTGSAANDTIIGSAGTHQLTIVDTSGIGTFGTASLDGGAPAAWTNLDTNLQVDGSDGATVFIDTTAITPGFSGAVAITANGTLSTDGGLTSVAINFSGNQVVTNSTNGAVTNVNSTNILRTGTDYLNYTGTYDAFQALVALRDDLRNTRNLGAVDLAQSISQRISELDRLGNNFLKVIGEQGANLQNLEGLQGRIKDVRLETRKLIAEREDVDVSEVVVNLQAQQQQLQLTLAAAARIFDQSLLQFIS